MQAKKQQKSICDFPLWAGSALEISAFNPFPIDLRYTERRCKKQDSEANKKYAFIFVKFS